MKRETITCDWCGKEYWHTHHRVSQPKYGSFPSWVQDSYQDCWGIEAKIYIAAQDIGMETSSDFSDYSWDICKDCLVKELQDEKNDL